MERNYVSVTLCITPLKCFSATKRYHYPVDNGHDDDAAGMKTESVNGTVSDVQGNRLIERVINGRPNGSKITSDMLASSIM